MLAYPGWRFLTENYGSLCSVYGVFKHRKQVSPVFHMYLVYLNLIRVLTYVYS